MIDCLKKRRNRRAENSEAGFTLMELIIVLVLLAMLMAAIGSQVYNRLGQGRVNIAQIQISEIESSLQLYSFDIGHFPTDSEGLEALAQNLTGAGTWKGPYLRRGVPLDPWEKPYVYKSPGDHGDYDLYSLGADGIEGTEDDVCNWK